MKAAVYISIIMLITGCSYQSDYEMEIQRYEDELTKQHEEYNKLSMKYTELDNDFDKLTTEFNDIQETLDQVLENNEFHRNEIDNLEDKLEGKELQLIDIMEVPIPIDRLYMEESLPGLAEFMEVIADDVEMKILPYTNAYSSHTVGRGRVVQILANLYNAHNEEWVYVRDIFMSSNTSNVSTGYIPLASLKEIEIQEIVQSDVGVSNIRIGDSIESVIAVFGRDFKFHRDTYYKAIEYDGIIFELTDYGYFVTEIHLLSASDQVDDYPYDWNLMGVKPTMKLGEAISILDLTYPRYMENEILARDSGGFSPFIEYDIGSDYVLRVGISAWEYDASTMIEHVSVGSKHWIY